MKSPNRLMLFVALKSFTLRMPVTDRHACSTNR
jgi:hypothetical protein